MRGHVPLQTRHLEVGGLVLPVPVHPRVGIERGRGVVDRHPAEVLAVELFLRMGGATCGVRLVEQRLVIAAQHAEQRGVAQRLFHLDEAVGPPARLVGQRAIGALVLAHRDHLQPVELGDRPRVDRQPLEIGVPAPVDALGIDEELLAQLARDDVDVATIAGLAEIGRIARAAIDDDPLIRAIGEVRGRVVRRIVRVLERDAVVGDVVMAVGKAAQRDLGIAQPDAVAR